ncbi:hypothetical protein FORMB_16790 [Formosa sp. Hel1_33_131]|uniref:hypothetical protein n=1 Tax=Formosa sp. Hel1_33_131 TaxID=1336794 RepID=UPI00084E2DDF|nr:hypothetical protein [Formosa sp. Hel1_33_131]AOR28718.1 hypothetical protein FORMB_16790 [Formosa sp. Hel1_33_131]
MKLIQETPTAKIYLGKFQGKPCRYIEDKKTGERTLSLEDVAKCLGFKNSQEMFSNDKMLDALGKALKKDPKAIRDTIYIDKE